MILVTGGTGFIGSHLVEELVNQGYKVVVPYIDIPRKSYFSVKEFHKKVTLVRLNITNRKKTFELIKNHPFDFIFHLAAQTLVIHAYKDPYTTLNSNIIGTVNILEAARRIKTIKGIIVASSDKAYGKTKSAYTETSALLGDHPYDVSKSSADLISQMYFKTYKTPVIITRFGNVYGEGDVHSDRIIPGICHAIIRKKHLDIRSNGKYVRDYLYVKDVVAGYLTLFENYKKCLGQAYNFSSKETYSVLELISEIEKILSLKIPYKILNIAQNEIPYQHLDDAKIRKLGWKNNYRLKTTISSIVEWYQNV